MRGWTTQEELRRLTLSPTIGASACLPCALSNHRSNMQARLKLAPPLATASNAALDAAVAELLDELVPTALPAVTVPVAAAPIDTIKPLPPAVETADALPATQELPAPQPAKGGDKAGHDDVPPLAPTRTDSPLLPLQGGTPAVPLAPASVQPSICFPSPAGGTALPNNALVALTPELLQQGQVGAGDLVLGPAVPLGAMAPTRTPAIS